jgi:DNA (cytosine-5)-methyltransferase 1
MIHFSLFSGIGGFELASEWAGWNNYLSCDINEFGNKILSYYWPEAYHHKDIHTLNNQVIDYELTKRYGSQWRSDDIILTGGFPCQPYSAAGKRLGKEDDRHLWPEMLRVIREVKPTWVVGENVLGLVNWNDGLVFNEVQADLEAEGYEVQAFVLPAASVNAPHRRDRVWFVAYCDSASTKYNIQTRRYLSTGSLTTKNASDTNSGAKRTSETSDKTYSKWSNNNDVTNQRREEAKQYFGCNNVQCDASDTNNSGLQRSQDNRSSGECRKEWNEQSTRFLRPKWQNFPTQSPICGGNDGLPNELDGITFSKWRNESIKAYGNAIVPQVAYQIFKAINEYNDL